MAAPVTRGAATRGQANGDCNPSGAAVVSDEASLREKQEQPIRLSSVLSAQSHVSPPPEPPVPHTVRHESIRQRRAPPRST
ncbi:hypothetical protein PAL_GLEAN10021979 [Pteropus alecto]|uniref:Uncharacterized protein n=1 Tax=Pteropus alecto TaxID=9402 RepID=L5KM96_PTEAL|nr:hypothetical protein PAL_GLEAN10021979 [Pteropus alecto]